MRFDFASPQRILFGAGSVREVPGLARRFGSRAFLVTGEFDLPGTSLAESLEKGGFEVVTFVVPGEPTIPLVIGAAELARQAGCDFVIGLGGGSVIDTGKAVSALLTNRGELLEYLEVIGQGRPLAEAAAPYIAVPTTAGTGSEVTRNAVIASPEHRVKASLRSPLMIPRIAVVDPDLTLSVPPDVTASTGMDALTQVIEPFVCRRTNPITDAVCREGIRRAARSLRRACADGRDNEARGDMALASLFGGIALANAGLGAVHGFAAPIGGMFPAPHGAVCARLLPFVFEVNVRALARRGTDPDALRRFDEAAALLTGDPSAAAHDGIRWLYRLLEDLGGASLGRFGLTTADVPTVVAQARKASSMKANPIDLTDDELTEILSRAL
jgi:alcohol dehydrogenase class IV